MRSIHDYSVVIFDCDGVIFDSNNLKILAMQEVLLTEPRFEYKHVEAAIDYFKNNFGVSRIKHVDYFIENFVSRSDVDKNSLKESILESYSTKCVELYGKADFSPGFLELLDGLSSLKYVASGSDEEELRAVFKNRGIIQHFAAVYGSPSKKSDVVAEIVAEHGVNDTAMIGDSVSDFYAAKTSNISFIYYSPYSNVKSAMNELKSDHGFVEMESF